MANALAFYVVFVFSVTCHEAAHAWAAKVGGDLTAYLGGQVSLDPIPHMKREPFGMVILPLITVSISGWPFGYASAPYDSAWAARYPRRAAWMALAGPGANLALVLTTALAIHIGMALGAFEAPDSISFSSVVASTTASTPSSLAGGFAFVLSVLFSMNLLLAVLNLIPLPPLDGSGALPLILPEAWNDAYQRFIHNPMLAWVGILIVWNLIGELFWPIFHVSIGLLYPGVIYG
jgi:Zn-dependent protease